ncbi:AAA family ATPase [Clostridium perfringens]|nr:AAA family ATPase [Clostridium perfringens]
MYFQHFKESEFKHHIPLSKFMKFNKYINVWGYDSNIVKDIKRWGEDKKYNLFDTEIYDEIFNFINPAIHLEGDGACISFDKKQKSLIESLENKKVKIKGVAGSGKSLVLAERAVNALNRTKSEVLILTFNITLRNYINYRLNMVRKKFDWSKFEINHFHFFINQKINQYGGTIAHVDYGEDNYYEEDKYYETIIEQLEGIKEKIKKYNAIFIDEGQDYDKRWFDIIEKYFLANNGEFVIFADEKQNIYNRAELDEDKRIKTNIRGRWNELNKTFRIGREFSRLAGEFQKEFLKDRYNLDDIKVPDEEEINMFDQIDKHLSENLNQDSIFNYLNIIDYKEIFKDIEEYARKKNIGYGEICILGESIYNLRTLEKEVRDKYNIQSEITFETEEEYKSIKCLVDEIIKYDTLNCTFKNYNYYRKILESRLDEVRKNKKYSFKVDGKHLKISTIHSFKGWEINTLVVILDENTDENVNEELIYTAITRCKKNLIIYGLKTSKYYKFFSENCKQVNNLQFSMYPVLPEFEFSMSKNNELIW